MWVTALCPKCGVKTDVDLSELRDEIACTRCFEKFALPNHLKYCFEEYNGEELVGASFTGETKLDSSFWLS
jgi:hypothetical protein